MSFFQTGYKGANDWWMYVVTLVLMFICTQIGSVPLIFVAFKQVGFDLQKLNLAGKDNFMNIGIDANLFLFLMILSFAVGIIGLYLGVKFIHKKQFKWIITARERVDWKRIFYGFFLWGMLSAVLIFVGIVLEPTIYEWNFNLVPFLILVVISFLFMPLQTSLEEFIFRGYLMQGIGLLVKNKWFPFFFTSILFGVLHGANPEIEKIGALALVFYIAAGFFFGLITLMDDGVELALGVHASNNIVAAILVTTDWTVFQTDALYLDTSEPSLSVDMFLPLLVIYPIAIVLFAKKYKWNNWKEKLFGKIITPDFIEK